MKCTRWLSRLPLLLLVVALPAFAEKVSTMPAPTGYVDDYASVISPSAKSEMESTCNEVHDKTRAQIFLVTIKNTEGEEVQTFANELFAKWKIGEKKTDRGVLILLAIDDRKRWIEIGYGLEGILNDAKVGDIGREMVPDLQALRYDDAAKIGIRDISQVIAQDAGVTLTNSPNEQTPISSSTTQPEPASSKEDIPWPFLVFLLFFIGFAFLTRHNRGQGGGSSGFGSLRSGDDSFGSGGSSDSDSFGGGDGGSSGGGGAGGDW